MRRVELHDNTVEIILTGLTMLKALQARVSIPYANIRHAHDSLQIPPNLLHAGGTAIGTIQEAHYIGEDGWYFLSYENPQRVITLELRDFHLGRQLYCAVAVEVDDPVALAKTVNARLSQSGE